jgi:hypothetical protein
MLLYINEAAVLGWFNSSILRGMRKDFIQTEDGKTGRWVALCDEAFRLEEVHS